MSSPNTPVQSIVMPIIVMVIGLLLVLGSIFADSIGLSGGGDGYGWKQLIATIVGLVILLSGAGMWMRRKTT